MNARSSKDDEAIRQHIAFWRGMIGHWNNDADAFRRMGRSDMPVSSRLIGEADQLRNRVRRALEACEEFTDNLRGGHELLPDLMQIATTLEALSESLAISADWMAERLA